MRKTRIYQVPLISAYRYVADGVSKYYKSEECTNSCDTRKNLQSVGITLAQFFTEDGGRLNLTEEQNEILEIWDGLETKEREIFLSFIRSLKK